MNHSMQLLRNGDVHSYNTPNKDIFRLSRVTRNWEKQRVCYQSLKDWKLYMDTESRKAPTIATFKKMIY